MSYNASNEYLNSLLNAYERIANSDSVSNTILRDEIAVNRDFVMTAYKGVTLGISITLNGDGKRLIMLGYGDHRLLNSIGVTSQVNEKHVSEMLADIKGTNPNIYKIFYVPNQPLKYYETYPLVSVEYLVSDLSELNIDLVTNLHEILSSCISSIGDILCPKQ